MTLQRELPWQTGVEIAYVGSEGHDLSDQHRVRPEHQPARSRSIMALGSALNQLVPNPFFGIVNSGVLVASQVSRAQLLRPYPQFTDIIPLTATGATSIYHALQLSVNRRMSGGLMLAGSYAWSKAIEEGESPPEQLRHRCEPIGRVVRHPAPARAERAVRGSRTAAGGGSARPRRWRSTPCSAAGRSTGSSRSRAARR